MEMTMDLMKGTITPTREVEEMTRGTRFGPLLTGENLEVEDEDTHQLAEEFLKWKTRGSRVLITGSLIVRIPFNHTLPKWNHTTAHGGSRRFGQTDPTKWCTVHLFTVQHRDTKVKETHLSMATPQAQGHPPRDKIETTLQTEGLAPPHLTRDHSEVPKDSPASLHRRTGDEAHLQEEDPTNTRVMAWSAGRTQDHSLLHTMESHDPLVHRGAPERCMGEARVQRGTRVKQQPQLVKIVTELVRNWPFLLVTKVFFWRPLLCPSSLCVMKKWKGSDIHVSLGGWLQL